MSNVSIETQYRSQPIVMMRDLAVFKEQGIVNRTGYDLYMCDNRGNITYVQSSTMRKGDACGLQVIVRQHTSEKERVYDAFGIETSPKGSKGIEVVQLTVDYRDLISKGFVYLKELEVCFSLSAGGAKNNHPEIIDNIEKYKRELLEQFKAVVTHAPLRFIVNDPKYRTNEIYTIINGQVLTIPVTHYETTPEECTIVFGCSLGNNSSYELDLVEVLSGKQIFEQEDGQIFYLTTTRDEAKKLIFKSKQSETLFTQKELQVYCEQNSIKLQRRISELEDILRQKEINEKLLREENVMLRTQLAQFIDLKQKTYEQEYRRELNQSSLAKEQVKLDKERVSKSASDMTSTAAMLKALGAIVPVAVGAVGLYGLLAGGTVAGVGACYSLVSGLFL